MGIKHIKYVKSSDMNADAAVAALISLNDGVTYCGGNAWSRYLKSIKDPANLVFPEGWYFCKHCFRNKHNSSTGLYEEVPVYHLDDEYWDSYVVETAKQASPADYSALAMTDILHGLNHGSKKVDPWTISVRGQDVCEDAFVLTGWVVKKGNDGVIEVSNSCGTCYILY
jgi:hypothetical protein